MPKVHLPMSWMEGLKPGYPRNWFVLGINSCPRLAHGWKHLDGDGIMHCMDPKSKKLTEGLVPWQSHSKTRGKIEVMHGWIFDIL